MSLRSRFRGSLPYAVAVIGGFLLAYLIVAFLIFPSGVIPGNAKVPNVTGLPYNDAAKRLAEVGFKAERGDWIVGGQGRHCAPCLHRCTAAGRCRELARVAPQLGQRASSASMKDRSHRPSVIARIVSASVAR